MLLKTSLRNLLAHKGRMILSLIAVVLSVAFISGTLVFSNTATSTFDKLFASTASDLSVQKAQDKIAEGGESDGPPVPTGKPSTVPVDTVRKLAALPGVKSAIGQIFVQSATLVDPATNKAIGPTTGAPTLTGNWADTPRNSVDITSGTAPHGPGQIMLDADTAKKAKLKLGSPLRVIAPGGSYDFTLSGIVTFRTTNPGAALAFLDTPTAQKDLLGETAYSTVELFGDGSHTDEQLKKQALDTLGTGFEAKTAAEQKEENAKGVGSFLNFMKYAMLGFAGISLLVGGFLIINTFSMLVAQRTREIGLLRALGGSRQQVNRSVLIEALVLGVLGSTIGLAVGLGLAMLLIQLMKAVGMNLDASSLDVTWTVPVASYTVGIVITVLSAWIPARRAGRISPMAALRDHGTPAEASANRKRAILGLLVTAVGVTSLLAGSAADVASVGGSWLGLGVLTSLLGIVIIGPLLATAIIRVLGAALPALFGPAGKLALRNAMRNPRRTGATAAALMIGLALVTGASVVTSSMVSSVNSQIDSSVGADYIVTARSTGVTAEAVEAARKAPGLAHITEQKSIPAVLTTPDGATTKTQVTAADATLADDFRMTVTAGSPQAAFGDGITVDQDFATKHNIKVGDRIKADYGNGHTQTLPLAAVTTKGTLSDGQFFTGLATVAKTIPADELPADQTLFAEAAPGTDPDTALAALQKSLEAYPQIDVRDQAGYKDMIQSQVNQLLYMVYGLLGLAIVVAVLGVVNTLALSVVERTREIGLLRAIGLSRRQLRRMVRLESVVIAVFGALLGTGLGLAWGVTARQVLADQGLGVLTIPVGTIVGILVASAVVGLLAALVPAFRAARMNILAAIATD